MVARTKIRGATIEVIRVETTRVTKGTTIGITFVVLLLTVVNFVTQTEDNKTKFE